MAEKFTRDTFESNVIEAKAVALVDFYADWCGPCKMMAPVIEQIAQEYSGRVVVGKINTDEEQSLAMKYDIMNIPTLLMFKDGEQVDMLVGYQSPAQIKEMIEKYI